MEITAIIKQLREKLNVYKETEPYLKSNYSKDIVAAIEMSMLLIEFAERNKSKIREEDKFWFKGGYQVNRHFDGEEWRNIGSYYDKLVEIATNNFF